MWESKAALAKYHSTRGQHKPRKIKQRGSGKGRRSEQGRSGAAAVVEDYGEEEGEKGKRRGKRRERTRGGEGQMPRGKATIGWGGAGPASKRRYQK